MTKQPTAEDLGAAPGVAGARPVGNYDVDAYGRGTQKIADAGERFGASVTRLGESAADFAARRRARQEFIAAQTQALTGLIGMRPRYAADPDYTTIKRRWTDEVAKTIDEPAILISSEPARLAYYDSLHEPLMQESRNISRQAFQGAADAHAAHREQLLQQLEQNLSTDPDDALSTAATYNIQSNIDDAIDKHFLTPEQATAEKKAAALRLTAANYGKLAQADPARAIAELTAEESPHPLVRYLPPETRDSLVARAQLNARAGQLDAERNAVLAAQESQRAAARAQDGYVKLAFQGTPDLASRIANDSALTPDSRRRLLDTAQRTTQPDPPAAASKANALQLLDRIRRDDGDPERLVDPDEILDAYNKGDLSREHYDYVRGQFDEARTPEGARLAAQKRAFMQTFKPVVDPARPDADAIAAEQRFQVEQALAARVTGMRDNNQDPSDLFDPSTPDYIRALSEHAPPLITQQDPGETATQTAPAQIKPAGPSLQSTETTVSPPDPQGSVKPQETTPLPDSPQPDHAELRTYNPSVSEKFKYGLQDALTATGMKPFDAAHLADAFTNLAGFYPPLAYAFSADDFKRALQRGDILAALWAAATIVPPLRNILKRQLRPRRIFEISEAEAPNIPKAEASAPAKSDVATKSEPTPTSADAAAPSEPVGLPNVDAPPRQDEAFASLRAARQRITNSGLDRFTGNSNIPEVLKAINDGTAVRFNNNEVGFYTSDTFKEKIGHAPLGYQWHHIVPQHTDNINDFGHLAIHNTSNMILLPTEIHLEISKAYSRAKSRGVSGQTFRDWLKPMTFDKQHEEGVKMINEVLQERGLARR